ncbi:MAG: YfcE family phosphodiesterase [Candidatus Methanomethylicota archaeon]|uniref:Phosphoesterase n=1 Tax=Thermoproteota archaeon TaxID=2056631 RepID=A0A497F1K1_9CREN|nr:MAG: YfcE family phosphodiesterase [Candidatus Verstraetearchaeota archaeon]
MFLGVISDTHDNLSAIEKAVEEFNKRNVALVLHAGDFVSPFTANIFSKLKCKLIGVFGNVDGEKEHLKERFNAIGAEIVGDFAEVEFHGVKIALIHGVHEAIVKSLAKSGEYALVVRGHTHRAKVEKIGEAIVVNPGEACGYLTGNKTIAVIKIPELVAEMISL